MNLGDLLKLVIPALFLVIWAVNQLLGKEEVTAPPRGQPIGPRPGGLPPAPRPPASQEVPQGWTSSPTAPPQPPTPRPKPVAFQPEDVFVIRADGDSIVRPAPGPALRPARSKPPRKRSEPAASRRLGEPLPTSVNAAPIDVNLGVSSSSPTPVPTTTAHPLAELIRSPGRLREALILNEVLGPPRALRGVRR